jgi:hypothetical protein
MTGARLKLTLVALAAVPVLAGCVVFKSPPKGKQVDRDTVRVTFTVCASSTDQGSSCPDLGNSGDDADDFEANVLLLGFRVPIGSRLPDKLRPVTSDVPGVVRRSRQYGRVLNDEAPTPVGFKWIGYRSPVKVTSEQDEAKFKVDIGLPRNFRGSRFRFRPVVGYFQPDGDHPADSPIVCGEALFDRVNDDDGDRTCIDSPTPDEAAAHLSIPLG